MKSTKKNNLESVWNEALESGLIRDDESMDDYKLVDYRENQPDVSGFGDLQTIYSGLEDLVAQQPAVLDDEIAVEFDNEIKARFIECGIHWDGKDLRGLMAQLQELLMSADLLIADAMIELDM